MDAVNAFNMEVKFFHVLLKSHEPKANIMPELTNASYFLI